MSQQQFIGTDKRSLWMRGLFMVLMALIYQLCGTLLFIVAVIQFLLALLSEGPNARLLSFGRSLASYLGQLTRFLSFASEEIPFPFSDWPEEK
jgi:hypothetical protein